eukprot:3419399-Prymnesium_polylepis.2
MGPSVGTEGDPCTVLNAYAGSVRRAIPAYGARLRARFALIFGKANRCTVKCLSGGATHRPCVA